MEMLSLHKFLAIGLSAVVDLSTIKRATYCIQGKLSEIYMILKK